MYTMLPGIKKRATVPGQIGAGMQIIKIGIADVVCQLQLRVLLAVHPIFMHPTHAAEARQANTHAMTSTADNVQCQGALRIHSISEVYSSISLSYHVA